MKKTSNITWQEEGDFLADLLTPGSPAGQVPPLAHAVNLFVPHSPESRCLQETSHGAAHSIPCLPHAQHQVIQSMRKAADFASEASMARPDLLGIAEAGDLPSLPPDFEKLPIEHARKAAGKNSLIRESANLPLLFDVLSAIQRSKSNATHIVFSNSDINLQPWFYAVVGSFLQSGYDSLIINRRTVENDACNASDTTKTSSSAPEFIHMAESGKRHPGLDCFVFPKSWLNQFDRTEAIIGRGAVMRSMLFNLVAIAENLLVLTHTQMTYHYGDDRFWMLPEAQESRSFNKAQAAELWLRLVQNKTSLLRLSELGKLFPVYLPKLPKEVLAALLSPTPSS
jgi:hypothetical protein